MDCSAKQLIRDAVHKNDFLKQLAKEQVIYYLKKYFCYYMLGSIIVRTIIISIEFFKIYI